MLANDQTIFLHLQINTLAVRRIVFYRTIYFHTNDTETFLQNLIGIRFEADQTKIIGNLI